MNYPYPKKAIIKYVNAYKDGGTKQFEVLNSEEIGIKHIFQDFRLHSTSQGKFFTDYPGGSASVEIIDTFIDIQVNI